VLLFAKQPARGKVKTRLAREIGEARATALYEAMLHDSVERSRAVRARSAIAYSPVGGTAFFAQLAPEATLLLQPEGDLGARLRSAFDTAFALGFERVAALGSDAPHVPAAWIDEGFERLASSPAVIGPAEDGGYWLIGLARPEPRLFERVRWSTPSVLADTRARAAQAGLELAELQATFDVDTAEDLASLREQLAAAGDDCTNTRAWFERAEPA
jgi:rSAM/selenodomain-associated transferase 1